MIIKGGSRGGPEQLARHLQRRDTNELVDILEVNWATSDLNEAFRDWQTLSQGTRGWKGLYHVNIDPAEGYVMSMEQWQRSVEVLEKALGFEGQPRAVVMHQKHGRQHLHVVWARTDTDTMTMRSDGNNYLAHERASKALELEFGHELVPGKHAKRDREKQPEFPRAEMTQDEWQQWERTRLKPEERKAEITALKEASDSAQAFKAALEEQGYILAKGDRRDFVIVDVAGTVHSLGRQVRGMKAAELREFMKGIDREALPTAHDAAESQKRKWEEKEKQQQQKAQETAAEQPAAEQPKQEKGLSPAEIEAIKKAVSDRHAEELKKWNDLHAFQLGRREFELETLNRQRADALAAEQQKDMDALKERLRHETSGLKGFIEAIQARWNPTAAAEKAAARRRQIAELERRQERERKDLLALREQTKQLEIENLKEKQAQELSDLGQKTSEDLERYIQEAEAARELQAELEAREREQQEKDRGPEWPPPTRAR